MEAFGAQKNVNLSTSTNSAFTQVRTPSSEYCRQSRECSENAGISCINFLLCTAVFVTITIYVTTLIQITMLR